jgi:hypothetical protein
MQALLGWSAAREVSTAAARAWVAHIPVQPVDPFVQKVVDVLRFPTAAEATDELLAALTTVVPDAPGAKPERRQRLGENLRWIGEHYPGVTLNGLPACPDPRDIVTDPRAVGLRCPPQ